MTEPKQYTINGKTWTSRKLARHCGITMDAAYQRMWLWKAGKISLEKLFHVGNLPKGGRGGRCYGTKEWCNLSDSEKSAKPLHGGAGTWEKKHIPMLDAVPHKQWERRVNARPPGRPEGEKPYYNPMRIAL